MNVRLKKDNGLPRRSVAGKVFYVDRVVEVEDDFDYRKYGLYLERVLKEEITEEVDSDTVENTLKENGGSNITTKETIKRILREEEEEESELTKKEIIERILEEFPEKYTKSELTSLKKDVLLMTLKGEFE